MEIVYTICGDEEEAEELGRELVESKLAACTNHWVITSSYSWKSGLDTGDEVAMIIKTRKENVSAVFEKVRDLHSYEVPALFSIPVNFVDDDYLEWLFQETEPQE